MEKLKPPEEFKFPFEPYPIQHDFMTNLYAAIEDGKLAIFESPTGTGKSLSIICGAFQWLQDHEYHKRSELNQKIENLNKLKKEVSGSDDWLSAQSQEIELTRQINSLQLDLDKINKFDNKIEQVKSRASLNEKSQRSKWLQDKLSKSDGNKLIETVEKEIKDDDIDSDVLLEDFVFNGNVSESDSENEDEEENEYQGVKIYFCSRTHSQLAQFVGETLRSPFGITTRLVTLASRQNYCINDAVNKLKSTSLINERCLDLQRNKKGKVTSKSDDGKVVKRSKTTTGCPYMVQANIDKLKDEAIIEIKDVEQLVTSGKRLKACPYYASRAAVPSSQIIVVPYNTLLHKSTREASGIQLKGNVVIIDEAHNLLDSIGNIHSSEVTGNQLTHAYSQLIQYRDKYSKKFNTFNFLYLNQVIFVVGRFIKMLGGKPGMDPNQLSQNGLDRKLYTLQDFVLTAEIDNFNLFKLLEFCKKSKINQKLHCFTEKYQPTVMINEPHKPKFEGGIKTFLGEISKTPFKNTTEDKKSPDELISNNPLLFVISFIECLTNDCEDGRIVCSKAQTVRKGSLKFLLLNPAAHFSDIVRDARSVIVAGGTMQPFSEFRDQLFIAAGGKPERIMEFTCDHIIPKENILPITLKSGPTGEILDFSYNNRNNPKLLQELGCILQNVCNIIPGGVVCFFPSYDYENKIYEYFEKNGFLDKLKVKKKIFREPKRASDVDTTLEQYANIIEKCKMENSTLNGALMFSVVGGKLSEGLNFSDDLGRCVILVGMPYPNLKSPELHEKMKYLNANINPEAGNVHYENLCMKAVNQCIGRAVRHRNDYASVLLLDQRYSRTKTVKALPAWIQRSYVSFEKFGQAIAMLARFFVNKRVKT